MVLVHFSTRYPWAHSSNDSVCGNFTTTFSNKKKLPMVALASFPASGNTLMRYLIEGITGIFTGSFYYGRDYGPKGIKRQNLMYASPFAV